MAGESSDHPAPAARTPADLQRYLTTHRIDAEILHVTAETPTVPAAADALGVAIDQIVKTVLFLVDSVPVAVLANGTRRVDRKKVARALSLSPNRVKLADSDAVLRHIGYAPGTVPPFDHISSVRLLIDRAVLTQELVFAGGGGLHAMLKIRVATLMDAAAPEPGDFLEDIRPAAADLEATAP
jgi:prolyl-tRNA editing enzyme YbaK/EbsC (Cys-tRNA(Pro) deacylase)